MREKTLVCRGPTILTDARQRAELAAVYAAAEHGDVSEILDLAETVRLEVAGICRAQASEALPDGWRVPAPARPDRDPVEEAVRIVGSHTESCGCVLNDVILDAGADGREHSAPCPRCGNVFTWRAPRFD